MERRGDRIDFSRREFDLCGLGSIPVAEASSAAASLYAQSAELYEIAFSDRELPPGEMRVFNRATDMRLLTQKVEAYAPELDDKNIAKMIIGFEALLRETPDN